MIKTLGDLTWRDHKAALWWLGLLYRRPRRFQEALRQLSWRRSVLAGRTVLGHALLYVFVATFLGRSLLIDNTDFIEPVFGVFYWTGVGLAFGIVLGFLGGISRAITLGIAFGVSFGTAGGIVFGSDSEIAEGIAGGIAIGIGIGVGITPRPPKVSKGLLVA